MRKFSVISLGCPKNQVDSEVLIGELENKGYIYDPEFDKPDFVVVNTCGFIQDAVDESYDTFEQLVDLKNQGKIGTIVVTGCLVHRFKEKIRKDFPEIDLVLGIDQETDLADILERKIKIEKIRPSKWIYSGREPRVLLSSNYAYIKISEGCNRRCSFCIIPRMRGRYRSRKIEEIIDEAYSLAHIGIKEIILIAQDLTLYGYDIYNKPSLDILIKELNKIPGIQWIRLLYLYPSNVNRKLLDAIGESEKLAKYLHVPIQHASDKILKLMRRAGGRKGVEKAIFSIRKYLPDFFIRTEVIAGFPGESEDDFNELVSFINDIRPERIAIFPYSDEKEAASYRLPDKVPDEVINDRVTELSFVAQDIMMDVQEKFVGGEIRVLMDNEYEGRTEFDSPEIDFVVKFKENKGTTPIVKAKILRVDETGDLIAE